MEVEVARQETPRPTAPATESRALKETLRRFEAAHARRSFDDIRACFHDEAVIESVASGSRPLGPDETVFALGEAMRDGVYLIYGWKYEEIAPDVFLLTTRARHRTGDRALRDETVYRIVSGRDGLMWRVRMFRSRSQALACYELHGPELDLTRP